MLKGKQSGDFCPDLFCCSALLSHFCFFLSFPFSPPLACFSGHSQSQGSAERQTVGLPGRGQLQASGDSDRGGMGGGCVFRKRGRGVAEEDGLVEGGGVGTGGGRWSRSPRLGALNTAADRLSHTAFCLLWDRACGIKTLTETFEMSSSSGTAYEGHGVSMTCDCNQTVKLSPSLSLSLAAVMGCFLCPPLRFSPPPFVLYFSPCLKSECTSLCFLSCSFLSP